MFRTFLYITLILCISLNVAYAKDNTKNWLKSNFTVKEVQSNGEFIIDFHGNDKLIAFSNISFKDKSKTSIFLKRTLLNKKVTVIPEKQTTKSNSGAKKYYVFKKSGSKKEFINKTLIEKDFATFKKGKSSKYQKLVAILEKTKNKNNSQIQVQSNIQDTVFYAGKYSKKYHRVDCRWIKKTNDKIKYNHISEAELAGKSPCNSCLLERVRELRLVAKKIGKTFISSN